MVKPDYAALEQRVMQHAGRTESRLVHNAPNLSQIPKGIADGLFSPTGRLVSSEPEWQYIKRESDK